MVAELIERAAGIGELVVAGLAPGSDAAAQARGIAERAHRPYPLPGGPWVQGQSWLDLLFAHWPLPVEALRPVVPHQLPLDTYDGHAWIGITPFEVSGLRVHGAPPVPCLSRFPETNVRTYTTVGGRPGICFFSLDAASAPAVAGAHLTYRLPYFRAAMRIERTPGDVVYRMRRRDGRAELAVRYRPAGLVFNPRPGTLEHFLTERYCLYTIDGRGRVLTADIHHPPWPLQPAEVEVARNTMTAPIGVELPDEAPLAHYSARQDVLIWPPRRV
jgi:uncharacterized protein YqjF (DUF2071 family)